jgi:hypothetical protein
MSRNIFITSKYYLNKLSSVGLRSGNYFYKRHATFHVTTGDSEKRINSTYLRWTSSFLVRPNHFIFAMLRIVNSICLGVHAC